MKKNLLTGLTCMITLLSIALFPSCKKSDEPASALPTSGFTWTVGGTTYTADTDTAFASFNTIIAKEFDSNIKWQLAIPSDEGKDNEELVLKIQGILCKNELAPIRRNW